MAERQSARMSKITNDGLAWSGTGCFIAVPMWQQWASKGYNLLLLLAETAIHIYCLWHNETFVC